MALSLSTFSSGTLDDIWDQHFCKNGSQFYLRELKDSGFFAIGLYNCLLSDHSKTCKF